MFKLLIFGGTTEGRLAAEFCGENGISCEVCVATDYGASLLPQTVKVHIGRLDSGQMAEFMTNGGFTHIIDATHPYAKDATVNIKAACNAVNLPYYRLLRDSAELHGETAATLDEVIEILNGFEGNILCTLGSKNMAEMARVRNFGKRMWLRVLPADGIIEKCRDIGFDGTHIICGKGPFSVEQNMEHIRMSGAEILVTKESGSTGGYPEKAEAAEKCDIRLLTLARPQEDGMTLDEIKQFIRRAEK